MQTAMTFQNDFVLASQQPLIIEANSQLCDGK